MITEAELLLLSEEKNKIVYDSLPDEILIFNASFKKDAFDPRFCTTYFQPEGSMLRNLTITYWLEDEKWSFIDSFDDNHYSNLYFNDFEECKLSYENQLLSYFKQIYSFYKHFDIEYLASMVKIKEIIE